MKREDFVKVAEKTLDSVPEEFRIRIQNVAILVEDFPANQRPPKLGQRRRLLLGIFQAVCSSEAEVRHQIRQTLIHELGHYFGMTEAQLRDV